MTQKPEKDAFLQSLSEAAQLLHQAHLVMHGSKYPGADQKLRLRHLRAVIEVEELAQKVDRLARHMSETL